MLRLVSSQPLREPDHVGVGEGKLFDVWWNVPGSSICSWQIESGKQEFRIGLDEHTGHVLQIDPIFVSGAPVELNAHAGQLPTEPGAPCFDAGALTFEGSWICTDPVVTFFRIECSDESCTILWGVASRRLRSGRVEFGLNHADFLVSVGVRWRDAEEREQIAQMLREREFP